MLGLIAGVDNANDVEWSPTATQLTQLNKNGRTQLTFYKMPNIFCI